MQNVLLITVDSLRADHVGHMGYNRETTPNIDQLAESGHIFENAFAHACSTRPSFPSILTSVSSLMYGGYERVSDEQTLISEIFSNNGFRTAGFHSNLYLGADFGYDRGFDTFFDSKTEPSFTARLRQAVKDRLDSDGVLYRSLANLFETAERKAGANIGSAYVKADEITDMASDWVKQTGGGSHFLWVHYMDVHHPYVPPAEHQTAFRESPIGERRAIKLRRKMIEEPDAITDEELSDLLDLYDAEIRFTDAEISRLIETVRNEWGEPLILITADHGEEFLDHGDFSHHATFYDEVLHVPFMIHDGRDQGRYKELVGLQDVSPSLADYADLSIPDTYYGYSLRDLINGESWNRTSVIGDWSDTNTGTGERRFAYRDERWKFIVRNSGNELYNLSTDPEETTNLVEGREDVVERLSRVLAEHKQTVKKTHVDIGDVEMEENVRQRLRDLGYQE